MNLWHKESKRKRTAGILDPGNLLLLVYITLVVCLLIFGSMLDGALAGEKEDLQPGDVRQGELLISLADGRSQPAPLLSQRVAVKVSGITARVVVEQKFVNSHKNWIEAVYVFPLPDESSVDHLRLRVGERLLEGRIMEKEAAQKTHDQASREGRKSSLLVQNRANIFTSRVANIGPGEEVTVEIEYQQGVRLSDGVFSFRFPMVVGPRYIPGQTLGQSGEQPVRLNSTGWAADTDQVPNASEITPPVDLEKKSETLVELTVDLAAGIALSRLESLYHGIESEEIDKGHYSIRLTSKIKADRDFVLEWQPEDSQAARAALFAENLGKNQYMLLQLMPPQSLPDTPVPREVVFILDVSGSMAGTSIVQAKAAIGLALSSLPSSDHFNIIVFNNNAQLLFNEAKTADQSHLQEARRFIDHIKANGGTEMKPALLLALDGSHHHERLRQLLFLTDGAVGNEDELLKLIARRLGDARLFTVGIGSAPNSYFMTRAATMGRGTYTYIGKETEVKEKMTKLFRKIEQPVITDVKLNLSGSEKDIEIYPSPLPDLYTGEPLLLAIRTSWENETLHLTGTQSGKPWEIFVDTTTYGSREGIGALWARKKIRSLMESLALGGDREKVREMVLQTAMEHHLVSKYTSLVAVDTRISRPQEEKNVLAAVKTHLPQGWQASAVFGGTPQTATPALLRFLTGGFFVAVAASITLYRRRRWQSSGR